MIGYSQRIVSANKSANQKMLGVKLGRLAIKLNMSVIDIANHCNVSRTAVYAWFTGQSDVSSKHKQEVNRLIEFFKKGL
jgi:predicted transcriptional regulator